MKTELSTQSRRALRGRLFHLLDIKKGFLPYQAADILNWTDAATEKAITRIGLGTVLSTPNFARNEEDYLYSFDLLEMTIVAECRNEVWAQPLRNPGVLDDVLDCFSLLLQVSKENEAELEMTPFCDYTANTIRVHLGEQHEFPVIEKLCQKIIEQYRRITWGITECLS